jgi:hypothetical protein
MSKAAEWAARVAEWRASGMTAKGFCEGRGYSAQSLLYWSSKLRRQGAAESAAQAVPVARVIRRAVAPTSDLPAVVVRTRGLRVELTRAVDRSTLTMVFEVLGIVGGAS